MSNKDLNNLPIAKHWINGEWEDSSQHNESINPATGEVIGYYALGTDVEAKLAIKAALNAFQNTDWKDNAPLRYKVLNQLADLFESYNDDLVALMAKENGKTIPEATFEVGTTPSMLRYYASLTLTHQGRAAEWKPGTFSMVVKEAIGVAGISVPWNSPVALLIRALAPALAAGCSIVVKLPGYTAHVNALLSKVISEAADLPNGVVNMITGEKEVLSHFVASPDVPVISFTGSTTTGRAISAAGAETLKRFGLELGGKTPMIVFNDADLETMIPKLEKAVTVFAGQFCMTGSRLLVQREVADTVRNRLAERLSNVKTGPSADPQSDMGPLISRSNVDRVDKMVIEAIEQGAEVIVRGGPITQGDLAKGAFYQPCLLEVKDPSLKIFQQEVFGPVLTMQVFDTEEEAIDLANNSEYGLAAGVWSRDIDRPLRIAREIKAGTVWINDWAIMNDSFEEGGYKQSGQGRTRGLSGIEEFMETKHIVHEVGQVIKQ
jgi:betaine-aldehyde dehydrogenase